MTIGSWRKAQCAIVPGPGVADEPAVRLCSVSRLFGTVPALAFVSLTVERGESVVLRGPNGAGKTTLLHLLGTVLTPTFGSGRVLGYDLTTDRNAIRTRTELLSHRTRLYDQLTAVENLRLICRLHNLKQAGVLEALDRVGLGAVMRERVGEFSPGMRQRVALARLLLKSPELLLLDEPYASLDEATKAVVDEVLICARAQGRSTVFSTHDASRGDWADKVIWLRAGHIASPPAPQSEVILPVGDGHECLG
jgi:heme exporter protein A